MIRTGELQLRPVLMTCVVAGVGLLPAAMSAGIGSQVQKPLAVVVVTGMMLAPLVILVTLPVLISVLLAPRPIASAQPDRPRSASRTPAHDARRNSMAGGAIALRRKSDRGAQRDPVGIFPGDVVAIDQIDRKDFVGPVADPGLRPRPDRARNVG